MENKDLLNDDTTNCCDAVNSNTETSMSFEDVVNAITDMIKRNAIDNF